MKRCRLETQIDSYLLHKLTGDERDRFEQHYFNCPLCFDSLLERDRIIAAAKAQGPRLLQGVRTSEEGRAVSLPERVFALLSPRQWTAAAVSAALVLVIIFGALPYIRKSEAPQFFLNGESVLRGESLSLISPIIDVRTVPAYFEWKKLGDDIEYRIYVYNSEPLWSESTRETRIAIPQNVAERMSAGEKYSWQVKAFSSRGTLIAVSSRVQFKISLQ